MRRMRMKYILFLLLVLISPLTMSSQVCANVLLPNSDTERVNSDDYITQQLIVQFRSSIDSETKRSILSHIQAQELDLQEESGFSLLSFSKPIDVKKTIKKLQQNSGIISINPNYTIRKSFIPSEPYFHKQWYLNKIQVPDAWDITKGSSGIKVAIVDGGVQLSHPELKGKIIKPYDILTQSTKLPSNDHGTHIAGIIAALQNGTGTTGIAPNVKIIPINVFNGAEASIYDIAEGIYYAVKSDASIINLSLTSDIDVPVLETAINHARSKGVLVIGAAGNDATSKPYYPAAYSNVLGVSATDKNDHLSQFSNYGSSIDFSAPGVDIFSTISNSQYSAMDGTSMAAPIVSATAAMILSKNPFLTPIEVIHILQKSALDLGPEGRDPKFGYGRVNVYEALKITPGPMSNVVLNSVYFHEDELNELLIDFSAEDNTYISLYVEDSQGTLIKNLIPTKKWNGGKVSFKWDGKMDNGAYTPSGQIKIIAKTTNKKQTIIKTKALKVFNEIIPTATFSKSSYRISPAVYKSFSIPFRLNTDTLVTAHILDRSNQKMKRLFTNKPIKGGQSTINWDGLDTKKMRLKDGSYTLELTLKKAEGLNGMTKTIPIIIDTKAPTGSIVLSNSIFKMSGTSFIKANITLNETANSNVSIINSDGKIIKKLQTNIAATAGTSILTWNGQLENKDYTKPGSYRIKIELRDRAGNKKILTSKIFKLINTRKK